MRWSIVRLIWLRELRDQLRDRRTVFMVAILPVLVYPIAGFGVLQLAQGFLGQTHVVGVAGLDELLPWEPEPPTASVGTVAAAFALTPPPPGAAVAERACLAASLAAAQPPTDLPALVEKVKARDKEALRFPLRYLEKGAKQEAVRLERLAPPADAGDPLGSIDRSALDAGKIDLVLVVPPGFQRRLVEQGKPPELYLLAADKDAGRLLDQRQRVAGVLARWKADVKARRLARLGLPRDGDEPFVVRDPARERASAGRGEGNVVGLLVRVFPFVLVLWSLAGALYPAVDLCAGEKERGTMETLLISPAGREEIVWGKFLTIWVFSAATALLNLLSMALTTWKFVGQSSGATFSPWAVVWGVVLLLPLSAFFSAVCLAVGAYARSSKEGQYYLMPLFMLTMPLIFLTLAPGVTLNPFYSMVPVTGVALLLQRLMSDGIDGGAWLYFVPVLAPMVVYSWLALRWAIGQFQREEVLFREAERLDLGLWLRRLFRDKEELPTAGEAFFCFGLILGLRWLAMGFGAGRPLLTLTATAQLAFVAAPPLFMAVVLTTRPFSGLALRRAPWRLLLVSAVLGALVVVPLGELTAWIVRQFPALKALLREGHPLLEQLNALARGPSPNRWLAVLVLAVLPAVCEELAFRGLILTGLRRSFRPWTAVLLSAFLFSLYQMNVFQFAPHFVMGVVLGMLAVRADSVLPAVLFHLVYNGLLIAPVLFGGGEGVDAPWRLAVAAACALAAAGLAALVMPRRGGEGVA